MMVLNGFESSVLACLARRVVGGRKDLAERLYQYQEIKDGLGPEAQRFAEAMLEPEKEGIEPEIKEVANSMLEWAKKRKEENEKLQKEREDKRKRCPHRPDKG